MRQPGNRPISRTLARQRTNAAALPEWVAPQLTQLVDAAPIAATIGWTKSNMTTTACMRGPTAPPSSC